MNDIEKYKVIEEVIRLADLYGFYVDTETKSMQIGLRPNDNKSIKHPFLYHLKYIYYASTFDEILGFLRGWEAYHDYLNSASPEAVSLLKKAEEETCHQILIDTLESKTM